MQNSTDTQNLTATVLYKNRYLRLQRKPANQPSLQRTQHPQHKGRAPVAHPITMFADLLNALCSRSDRPVTNVSLARELTAQGCPISTAYLSQLRTGVRTQPTSRIVHTLATHFGVSVEYFYPTTTTGKGNAGITDPATVDNCSIRPCDAYSRVLRTCPPPCNICSVNSPVR
jgi:hypothetical protein